MKHPKFLFVVLAVMGCVCVGCSDDRPSSARRLDASSTARRPSSDTVYTADRAMLVYGYQPEWALGIIDTAVIVGNVDSLQADFLRAKVYAWTQMGSEVDSLLGGKEGVRYDSARTKGERVLAYADKQDDLDLQQNVLELLVTAARQQRDTTRWLQRTRQLVDVCHRRGAETEALRTEAEVGELECYMGKRRQGMARIDSVLAALQPPKRFNELDAAIIALKRKTCVLVSENRYVDALPVSRRIIEWLDDYEEKPELFHDGSRREPADSADRADYIQFYRTQAQNNIAMAYAELGELGNMHEAYEQMENSLREAFAREHRAHYQAFEKQLALEKAEHHHRGVVFVARTLTAGLLLLLCLFLYIYTQNRRIRHKNHALMRMMEEATPPTAPTKPPRGEAFDAATSPLGGNEGELTFHTIDTAIRTERLYADSNLQRQDVCERFHLRRETLNHLLSTYAQMPSFPAYINGIRLAEACRLLRTDPKKTVNAVAEEVGLSPRNLRRLFIDQYGMTPTEYRHGLKS